MTKSGADRARRPGLPATLLAALLGVTVAVVCVRLGFWQLDRLDQRRSLNQATAAATALPPIRLDSATVDRIALHPDSFLFRRAELHGRPVNQRAMLLRGRADNGRPGVHLALPVQTGADQFVVLNLGWLPAADGATVDPRPFLRDNSIAARGILMQMPPSGSDPRQLDVAVEDTTVSSLQRIDADRLRIDLGGIVAGLYLERVQGISEERGQPRAVPAREMTDGPHLSYAIQWFSFAAIAVGGVLILLVARLRRRVADGGT